MTDLFAAAKDTGPLTPLAERLRPKSIDEVIGQRHLLAPGKPLAVAFAAGKPHSMILWGPPGVGKTTLARLMADAFNADYVAISAVSLASRTFAMPLRAPSLRASNMVGQRSCSSTKCIASTRRSRTRSCRSSSAVC
jgi:replication-associated recombination protein RarA